MRSKIIFAWMMAGAVIVSSAVAEESQFSLGAGIDYSSGNYGQSQRTYSRTYSILGKLEYGDWTFRASLPYIQTQGPAKSSGTGSDRVTLGGNGGNGSSEGYGDLVVGAVRTVFQNESWIADIGAKAKFATGDAAAGLSTGGNDVSTQADVYRMFGSHALFGTLGWRRMGDSRGTDFHDPLFASLGWSWRASAVLSSGLSYDYRQRLLASGAPIHEVSAFVGYKLSEGWKLQAYAMTGFTRASPDAGVGLLVLHQY